MEENEEGLMDIFSHEALIAAVKYNMY